MVCVQDGSLAWTKVKTVQSVTLTIGMEIPVRVVKGGIRTPSTEVPCVFVGPGTGIAPMRAMIEQRVHEGDTG